MKDRFRVISDEINTLVTEWKAKLISLTPEQTTEKRNSQNRSVKQIVGHMIDSASNNTHRIIHMQYQESPVVFPDYANLGNNDLWIAIQNYQEEDWNLLLSLWVSSNQHIAHVINQIRTEKLNEVWTSALDDEVSLREMVLDYPKHFKLHLQEIEELI